MISNIWARSAIVQRHQIQVHYIDIGKPKTKSHWRFRISKKPQFRETKIVWMHHEKILCKNCLFFIGEPFSRLIKIIILGCWQEFCLYHKCLFFLSDDISFSVTYHDWDEKRLYHCKRFVPFLFIKIFIYW